MRSPDQLTFYSAIESASLQLAEAREQVSAMEQQWQDIGDSDSADALVLLVAKLKQCEEIANSLKAASDNFERAHEAFARKKTRAPEDLSKLDLLEAAVLKSKSVLNSQLRDFQTANSQLKQLAADAPKDLRSQTSDRGSRQLAALRRLLKGSYKTELRKYWRQWAKLKLLARFHHIDGSISTEAEGLLQEIRAVLDKCRSLTSAYQTALARLAAALQSQASPDNSELEELSRSLQQVLSKAASTLTRSKQKLRALSEREAKEIAEIADLEEQLASEENTDLMYESALKAVAQEWKAIYNRQGKLGEVKEALRELEGTLKQLKALEVPALNFTQTESIEFVAGPKARTEAENTPMFEFELAEEPIETEDQVRQLLLYIRNSDKTQKTHPKQFLEAFLQENYPNWTASGFLSGLGRDSGEFVEQLASWFESESAQSSLLTVTAVAHIAPCIRSHRAGFQQTGGEVSLSDAIQAIYALFASVPSVGEGVLMSLRPSAVTPMEYLIFMISFRLQIHQVDSLTFFKSVDTDNSRTLTLVELATGLRKKLGLWLAQENVVMAFQELDVDSSGSISRLEFTRKINLKEYYVRCEREEYRVTVKHFGEVLSTVVSSARQEELQAVLRTLRTVK